MSGTTTGVGIWTQPPLSIGLPIADQGNPTSGDDRFDGDAILVANVLGVITPTLALTATDNFANGGAGNDQLFGNGGDDTLVGGVGADVIDGGAGFDTSTYASSRLAVTVDLRTGTGTGGDAEGDNLFSIERVIGSSFDDTLYGGSGDDVLSGGSGNDTINGFAGANTLNGGAGNDTINGGSDNDRISGGTGIDILRGGDGSDRMDGGTGNDLLIGGGGADLLRGGDGADTFRYNELAESTRGGVDRVLDFSSAEGDKIDLSVFGASYAGDGPFSRGEASVVWRDVDLDVGSGVQVLLDADGNGTADLMVFLQGVQSLSQNDFIL
ncbi:calcium-binding protein [Roseomonas populi]|uniref:Peptidase M10 serralysin C-terminal domain-containing protein n=1 Tax=Roseomonas populi TaxID=3121582 RepID=A0ABT1XAM0_9PROT|nr:calcium-binding protein [Roseomonas pecuniae]MCR0984182.1 hypothetical protein [Roseomonas pecuniae]